MAALPMNPTSRNLLICIGLVLAAPAFGGDAALGLFSGQSDVGTLARPGTATYDAARESYTIGSGGKNMWFSEDDMHYVWKQVSGDLSIAADVELLGQSAQGHRKACLVIRQTLEPGSAMVDVAVHGDGLTSLQYRQVAGGPTKEIQSMLAGPRRVRLDKIGDTVYLSVAGPGEAPHPSGASIGVALTGTFYVGLAVCAHDEAAFEQARFTKVEVGSADPAAAAPQPGLRIITLPSGDRRVSDH